VVAVLVEKSALAARQGASRFKDWLGL